MDIVIVAFDEFTDLDVFLPWDLLNRVREPGWSVRLLGEAREHRSISGLVVPMHGHVDDANAADVVLFASGPATRRKYVDSEYLRIFKLDPNRQMIGSMCSGALILGGLGLLTGKEATTYPTAKTLLAEMGVKVLDRPFVQAGNIATAAGCLAGVNLSSWVLEAKAGTKIRDTVIESIQPVGEFNSRQTMVNN